MISKSYPNGLTIKCWQISDERRRINDAARAYVKQRMIERRIEEIESDKRIAYQYGMTGAPQELIELKRLQIQINRYLRENEK